jgi:L,D-transpeptidase YcbB
MNRIALIRIGLIALLLALVFLLYQFFSTERESPFSNSSMGRLIKARLEQIKPASKILVAGEQVYSTELVENFYKSRNYHPAWSEDGRLTQADQLISAAEGAYRDGLMPSYYHLPRIKSLVDQTGKYRAADPELLADLDVLLTDSFLTLGCHLSGGCVDPVTVKAEWYAKRGRVDVSAVLEAAIKKKQVEEGLNRMRPEDVAYQRLRQGLASYRELLKRGEWPPVSGVTPLKPDSRSVRVLELRKRLVASGDLKEEVSGGDFFDTNLKDAVKFFQRRHGIKDDGVVGPSTLQALNVPLKQRIRQMELNMERLRWILGKGEERAIEVNIANFELAVIENGKTVLTMKVVVGKPYWNTPVFTAKMTHIVINPSWNVPDSIAKEEIIANIKNDPDYLKKQNMKVLAGWDSNAEEIDPGTVDWSGIESENLKYRFRQEPGPLNALGKIKFLLPNKFDVYLHDTPSKGLFSEEVRTFSHGCTRVEKPVELAEYLLQEDPAWSRGKIIALMEEGSEKTVRIPQPVNVHFLYLTAWVDEDDILQFRNDIYGRDKLLHEALLEEPILR